MNIRRFLHFAGAAALLAGTAVQAVPTNITYTGELRAENGIGYTGEVDVQVSLFGGMTGGSALWSDDLGTITALNGVLQVDLEGAGLPALLSQHSGLWLEFTIDGEILEPRQKLSSVPYAHVAANAQMLGGLPASAYMQAGEGIGTADLATNAIGQVSNGVLSNEFMDVTRSWAGPAANILDAEPASPPPPTVATVATGEGAGSYLTGIAIRTRIGLNFANQIRITLTPPVGTGVPAIVLRDAFMTQGIYDEMWTVGTTPELAAFIGTQLGGTWALTVQDLDNNAVGAAVMGQLTDFEVLYDVVRADHLSLSGRLDVSGDLNVGGKVTANEFVGDGLGLTGFMKIRNITVVEDAVRKPMSASTSINMAQFTVDKKSPTSYLLVDGTISGFGLVNSAIQQGWKLGSDAEVPAQAIQAGNAGSAMIYSTKAKLVSSLTGPQTLTFRYYTVAGGTSVPFSVFNPNGTDDNRLSQTRSMFVVWEIEP